MRLIQLSICTALSVVPIFPFSVSPAHPHPSRTAQSQGKLNIPPFTALRVRMNDTLNSTLSMVGDPFSATVVDNGPYAGAVVYGKIASITQSGKVRGHSTVSLNFTRITLPDGRKARIAAEIVELYHAPSGEKVDVEGAIESSGRGKQSIERTLLGAGAGALLGGIFGGGKGAGIGSIIGGAGGIGSTAFRGPQPIVLQSGQEMLIRITPRSAS